MTGQRRAERTLSCIVNDLLQEGAIDGYTYLWEDEESDGHEAFKDSGFTSVIAWMEHLVTIALSPVAV